MLTRHAPLKRKREKPRRDEGRVQHGRMKRARTAAPDPIEAKHHARLRLMPCLGCGRRGGIHIHHVMHMPPGIKRTRRDHRYVLPLCDDPNTGCHQGDGGIHKAGSEEAWGAKIGVDVAAWAVAAWIETQEGASHAR